VCYQTKGFIDKNNDALHESLEMLMLESQDAFIKSLFEQPSGVRSPPDSRKNQGSSKKLALVSIASKFRSQLATLLEKLNLTGASFVRCLKPNLKNAPHLFMGAEILSQLHCAGLMKNSSIKFEPYIHLK
jgi:myosin-6